MIIEIKFVNTIADGGVSAGASSGQVVHFSSLLEKVCANGPQAARGFSLKKAGATIFYRVKEKANQKA